MTSVLISFLAFISIGVVLAILALYAVAGLGLGGVWLGCHGRPEREQAVRDVLGIPKEIGVLSVLSIGRPHPAEGKEPRTQFDAARVHEGRW